MQVWTPHQPNNPVIIRSAAQNTSGATFSLPTVHLVWNATENIDGHIYGLWTPAILVSNHRDTVDHSNSINTGSAALQPYEYVDSTGGTLS
jgi:hypothetical protein